MWISFFFQAEDGIRDGHVTGVQTCALPISSARSGPPPSSHQSALAPTSRRRATATTTAAVSTILVGVGELLGDPQFWKIGRASCRGREEDRRGGGRSRTTRDGQERHRGTEA